MKTQKVVNTKLILMIVLICIILKDWDYQRQKNLICRYLKRIILITEILNPPYDEGIKKTVFNLFSELDNRYELLVISRYAFEKENIHITNSNPLFLSSDIRDRIKGFNPDVIIYFPFASGTFAGYLRRKVLSFRKRRSWKRYIFPNNIWGKSFFVSWVNYGYYF